MNNRFFFYLTTRYRNFYILPLKRQEKNIFENVVCCSRLLQKMPNITDELSVEANSVDPEQTVPIGAV